jgi:hypothetical protein
MSEWIPIGGKGVCPYCEEIAFWLFGECICTCSGNVEAIADKEDAERAEEE